MCRKLIVMNKLSLGTRELGWEAWSLPKGEVLEFTGKQLKDLIKQGKDGVYGLELSEETGELVFDKGFYTTNLMNKVHINTLAPIVETESPFNLFYTVVGAKKGKHGTEYEVVSSRYERKTLTAENTKLFIEMGIINGGVKLEDGEIVLAAMERGM